MSSNDPPRDAANRFTARPRKTSSPAVTGARTQRTLDDMRSLYAEAQEIVDEGEDSFFDEQNLRTRRAATALIIHLSDAAHRKEIVAMHATFPDVNWDGLRKQRNLLGHKYHDLDFTIVWKTLSVDLPRERDALGLGP